MLSPGQNNLRQRGKPMIGLNTIRYLLVEVKDRQPATDDVRRFAKYNTIHPRPARNICFNMLDIRRSSDR